jgi:hypothetical protein
VAGMAVTGLALGLVLLLTGYLSPRVLLHTVIDLKAAYGLCAKAESGDATASTRATVNAPALPGRPGSDRAILAADQAMSAA